MFIKTTRVGLSNIRNKRTKQNWLVFLIIHNWYDFSVSFLHRLGETFSQNENGNAFFSIFIDVCANDMFRCNDGRCIGVSRVCNYIADCSDQEDEICGKLTLPKHS